MERLYEFDTPTHDALTRIAALAATLPVVDPCRHKDSRRKPVAQGPLEAISAALMEILLRDYEKTREASKDQPWTFDYVVDRDDYEAGELSVLTRLFHPQEPGNIFYGRRIRRLDEVQFALWSDD